MVVPVALLASRRAVQEVFHVELPGDTVNVKRLDAVCHDTICLTSDSSTMLALRRLLEVKVGGTSTSNSSVKLSGSVGASSGTNTPARVNFSQRPGLPATVTISPPALVSHLAGKSPIESCEKSSKATTFSPGTKSNLLNASKPGALVAAPVAGATAVAGGVPACSFFFASSA